MTDKATLEAVARAICKPVCDAEIEEAMEYCPPGTYYACRHTGCTEWERFEASAQAAIDAMPGWQPVTLTDIAVSGVRQAVHLQHEDLFVDYNKEGTFRLEFTQEQMRDLYNNIGAALHQPLPEPPEGADG